MAPPGHFRQDFGAGRKQVEMSFGKRHPTAYFGFDRRRAVRHATDVIVQIVLPSGQLLRCRAIGFSKFGARLEVPTAYALPDRFDLRALDQTFHVSVIRRGFGHVACCSTD
jgi:hypothetical protein